MNYGSLYFDQIDSTNDYLKKNHQILPRITFVKANHQTSGRGQFDRIWLSEDSQNILCSFMVKDISFNQLEIIESLTYNTLMNFINKQGVNPIFKVPNDIYLENFKIVGILIETLVNHTYYEYVVVGIGINVNQTEFGMLQATSLKKETTRSFDVEDLYRSLKKDLKEGLADVL